MLVLRMVLIKWWLSNIPY